MKSIFLYSTFLSLSFFNTSFSAELHTVPTQFEAILKREDLLTSFSFQEIGTEGTIPFGVVEKKSFKKPLTYTFMTPKGEEKGSAIFRKDKIEFTDKKNVLLASLIKKEDILHSFFVLRDKDNTLLLNAKLNLWGDEVVLIDPETEKEVLVFSRSFFRTSAKWEGQIIYREFFEKTNLPFYVILLSLIVELDKKETGARTMW